jgi:hypothetical protein
VNKERKQNGEVDSWQVVLFIISLVALFVLLSVPPPPPSHNSVGGSEDNHIDNIDKKADGWFLILNPESVCISPYFTSIECNAIRFILSV